MSVWICGFNGFGQISVDHRDDVRSPTLIKQRRTVSESTFGTSKPSKENNVVFDRVLDVAIGWSKIYLLTSDGRLQMPETSSVSHLETSRAVEEHDGHLVSISCGWTTACAAMSNSTKSFLWHMKHDSASDGIRGPDVELSIDSGSSIASVTTNDDTVYVVTSNRHLLSANLADAAKCGYTESAKSTLFFQPMLPDLRVRSVSCGKHHVLVLSAIGVVFSQGNGAQGQLGHGSIEPRPSAIVVEALEGVFVTAIAAGGWHSMALTDAGDLYVWGWNEQGQLGFPSENVSGKWIKGNVFPPGERQRKRRQSMPEVGDDFVGEREELAQKESYVNVLTLPHIVEVSKWSNEDQEDIAVMKIAAGSRHSVCLLDDGTTLTWGWNAYGQLGLGDDIARDAPCLVTSLHSIGSDMASRVTDVFAGWWNTVFVTR